MNYWRSIGDLVKGPGFLRWAQDEFPQMADELEQKPDVPSRRRFLQLMGASLAMAGLGVSGCRRPEGKIVPYNKKPVDVVLGKGMYYATTFVLAGRAVGVLAETHEGRPTKIEGNPLHPASRGGTDLFAQASVLDLYDPDRSRNFLTGKTVADREAFVAMAKSLAITLKETNGKGLAILSEDYASPAVEMLFDHIRKTLPEAIICVYEPTAGTRDFAPVRYDLSQADVIVALDCDLLGTEDEGSRNKLAFAAGRAVDQTGKMNRLYVVEPVPTITGAAADHRMRLPASLIPALAQDLAAAVAGGPIGGPHAAWIKTVADDLIAAGKRGLVVVGSRQPGAAQVAAGQINKRIPLFSENATISISTLAEAIRGGKVQTLLILGGNPAFNAPADLAMAAIIRSVPFTLRLGLHEDETSAVCTWHIPAAHYLESWGDARATDGTVSVIQPMIEPMFGGLTPLELLARISGYAKNDAYEITRDSFAKLTGLMNQDAWQAFLQEGVLNDIKIPRNGNATGNAILATFNWESGPSADKPEICFAADASIFDGRFANNGWLQECPDPVTKLTWDNAAIVSSTTAKYFKVDTGDVIRIEHDGRSVEAPVYVLPGVADWSITLPLGYGRIKGGTLCKDTGFDAYALRTTSAMGFAVGAKITPTGRKYPLATTQEHWAIDLNKHFANVADVQAKERALIREGSADEYQKDPGFAGKMGEHAPIRLNIYTSPKLVGANQWGMTIDLNACVGCNACTLACQAENNIPIVGKDEVIRGREMHWLRLDRYFSGDDNDQVKVTFEPMACQHCENAPCEPVCPVNATVHSPEGLNEMVYNRCIGTRYCSNNCPYKVRRFNFFDWNKGTIREGGDATAATKDGNIEPHPTRGFSRPQLMQPPMQEMLKMAQNPNVTVRMRGVMEKCTYCVQRIEGAKIAARSAVGQGPANAIVNGEPAVKVADGAIMTACQQVCPTKAILFGDVSDPASKVSLAQKHPRSYEVLEHLNVRPRTRYLAKIRNLNPRLASSPKEPSGKTPADHL